MGGLSKIKYYIAFILIMFFSCKLNFSLQKISVPNEIYFQINDKKIFLNDKQKKDFIRVINNSKSLNNDIIVPWIYDIYLCYEDSVINIKSDGVYLILENKIFYSKTFNIENYLSIKDSELLPVRPMIKKPF